MDIKNIIIMTILPIGQRDFDRFGIGYFIEQKKEVLVLNIRELIYRGIAVNYKIEQVQADFKYLEIRDYKALELELKKLDSKTSIVFTLFGNYKVYNKISKYNILFGSLFVNPVPEVKYLKNEKLVDKFKRLRKLYGIKNLLKKVLEKLYYKVCSSLKYFKNDQATYDFVVVAGKIGNAMKNNVSSKTKIIKAHTLDREFMLKDKNIDKITYEYIIYLDEYLPYHSDFDLIGIDNKKIVDIYYKKMNFFLDFLSNKYGKEVIICAHPRSEYNKYKVWGDKRIVSYKTYEYVKQAFMCITHASTSTNFAIMLNKPISFIYFRDIDFYENAISTASKSLGKDIINIELDEDKLDEVDYIHINNNKYKEYIKDYISENIEDKRLFWEKVLKELEEVY